MTIFKFVILKGWTQIAELSNKDNECSWTDNPIFICKW